jgi:hypothetical protein
MRILFLQWLHFMDGGIEDVKTEGQFDVNTHDCYTGSSYTEFQAKHVTLTG